MSEMAPSVNVTQAIEDHLAMLARGYAPATLDVELEGGGKGKVRLQQPIPDLAEKKKRAGAFGDYLTGQGNRILDQENVDHVAEHGALRTDWNSAVEAIGPLVATGSDGDLGDVGAYKSELYRIELNRLVRQHDQLVARQRTLRERVAQHAERRKAGGQAVYLQVLEAAPAVAAKAVQMLHGDEEFVVQPFKPQFLDVDADDLEPLRSKLQKKINRAEAIHAALLERDARRGHMNTMTEEELRKYPALRNMLR